MKNNFKMWVTLLFSLLILACAPKPDDKALGLAKFEITPAAKGLIINDTFQYTAKFIDARGAEQEELSITWMSSNSNIATISDEGIVTGVSLGQSQISASVTTDGSGLTLSNIAELTIVDNLDVAAKVVIENTESEFFVNDEVQFFAEVSNANGLILSDETISWMSNDSAIANIDESGLATLLSTGVVNITAMVDNIVSPVFTLAVRAENNSRTAVFQNAGGYNTSGTGTLQVNAEGGLEVVFSEDFSTENGPGLEVFLSKTSSPTNTSVNIGSLQSISGAQTYAVPSNVLIDDYQWIIIHCVPFNIAFGRGSLSDNS